jgi:hypothetical protein
MALEQALGLARPVLDREGAGDAKGVEPVQVAPGRQHIGIAQRVAPWNRPQIASVQGMQNGRVS